MSDAYRLLIEKLLSGSLPTGFRVRSDKLPTRNCYMQENAEVSITEICSVCKHRSPQVYANCPEVKGGS